MDDEARLRAARIWKQLNEMYGNLFVTTHGPVPTEAWIRLAGRLTDRQCARGLERLLEEGDRYPPSMPRFSVLCTAVVDRRGKAAPKSHRITGPEHEKHLKKLEQQLERQIMDETGYTQEEAREERIRRIAEMNERRLRRRKENQ